MRSAALTLAAVANGATGAQTNITTPDDNKPRALRFIYLSPATSGVTVELRKAGFLVRQVDALRFAAGNSPVEVDEVWPATINFSVDVVNASGGSYTGTVTLSYEPMPYPDKAP